MANSEHLDMLRKGAKEWNDYSEKQGFDFPNYPDLRNADLQRLDLTGANLTKALLTGCNLRGSDLSHAILRGAKLDKAELSSTKFIAADLREAHLSDVRLTLAEMQSAWLVSCQHCSVVNNVIYFFIIDLEDWDYEKIQRYAYRRGT